MYGIQIYHIPYSIYSLGPFRNRQPGLSACVLCSSRVCVSCECLLGMSAESGDRDRALQRAANRCRCWGQLA